jgi:hypothetical protein
MIGLTRWSAGGLLIVMAGFSMVRAYPAQAADPPVPIPGLKPVCNTVSECISRLEDEDPTVRDEAILTLGRIKDPQAVPYLIEIVKKHVYGKDVYFYDINPASHLALTAIRALGAIGDRRAIPVLVDFVKGEPFIQYRVVAAEMIRLIGVEPENIPSLLELLNDPHTSVRFVIFETIRRADSPVSKKYTQRFINYVPRADMIDDSVTPVPDPDSIGVPIYPGAKYLYYVSASEQWIMRERPQKLTKTRWLHTFSTPDSVKKVVKYYEGVFRRKAVTRAQIEQQYNYSGEEDPEPTFIGEGFGFIINRTDRASLPVPVVVVSVYEDKLLQSTAVTISAPR